MVSVSCAVYLPDLCCGCSSRMRLWPAMQHVSVQWTHFMLHAGTNTNTLYN